VPTTTTATTKDLIMPFKLRPRQIRSETAEEPLKPADQAWLSERFAAVVLRNGELLIVELEEAPAAD
jgi:hypothetical protein